MNITTIQTNWYDSMCPVVLNNGCNQPFNCQGYAVPNNQYIIQFVFKQQIHYRRYVNNALLNWVPDISSNGQVYVDPSNNSLISPNLTSELDNVNYSVLSTVVYPDYSKVDVGQGIKWPMKVFSPYVDTTAWPTYKFAYLYKTVPVPFFNLGFIVSESYNICKPTWGTYYSGELCPVSDQIKAIRALGGDVTISFGGAVNVPVHINAPDVTSLYTQYMLFTEGYKLTRIDFDIEGIWIDIAYQKQNMNNAMALKMLQDYYKAKGSSIDVWFTLPILPTGLTADGLRILQQAISAGVNISGVNALTMDYGPSAAPNPEGQMGMYGIQAITALKQQLSTLYMGQKTDAQLWAMIGTTPMLGTNDIQGEVFYQTDAMQTLQFAMANNIGLISMWSTNRDRASQSGIKQMEYEFQMIFNQYNLM